MTWTFYTKILGADLTEPPGLENGVNSVIHLTGEYAASKRKAKLAPGFVSLKLDAGLTEIIRDATIDYNGGVENLSEDQAEALKALQETQKNV